MILNNRELQLEPREQADLRVKALQVPAEEIEAVWLDAMSDATRQTSQTAQQIETIAPCVIDGYTALPFAGIALSYFFKGRRYTRLSKMRQMVTGITMETDTTHAI